MPILVSFFSGIGARWSREWRAFVESRNRLLLRRDYVVTLALCLLPIVVWPVIAALGHQSSLGAVILIIFMCLAYVWLAGVGFVTVGGVLFDNIPTVSDIAALVDETDGIGVEKMRYVSAALRQKSRFEEWVTSRLRRMLISMTVSLFRRSGREFSTSMRFLRAGEFTEMSFCWVRGLVWFFTPFVITATIGMFGLLTSLRPSIARLPVLAVFALCAVAYLLIGYALVDPAFGGGASVGWILAGIFFGYTYFLLEEDDFLMVRRIFLYVAGWREEGA